MRTAMLRRSSAIAVNINLRVIVDHGDYEMAYGPATKKEVREYVKATIYEAIGEGAVFPSDVPVTVEER